MGKQNSQVGKNPKRRQRPNGMGMLKSVTPLNHRLVTLAFAANHAGTESAAGTGVYNFYRLNGPYDPDTAVLSNATPGLSALAQLYRSMRVLSVRAQASGAWYVSANSAATCTLSLVPTAFQPVLPSNPSYWPVQPSARSATSIAGTGYATFPGGIFKELRGSWNVHDVLNVTKAQYRDESDYASLTNSNPTRQAYLAVAVTTNCGTVVTVVLQVVLEYLIEFFDPYPLQ